MIYHFLFPSSATDLVLYLVDDSSKDVNSVRSMEELNLVKLSKGNLSTKRNNTGCVCVCGHV